MTLDALVFSAHPDDAELSMGGTIARLAYNEKKIGIIDLTKGELGTRGSADIRQKEAFQAAIALKIALRENLNIPDGKIAYNQESLAKIVMTIRKYKPKIIFAPYFNDRHPDHIETSKIIKNAFFFSGLHKMQTFDKERSQLPFRPKRLFYYMQTYNFTPSFIIDVSDYFEHKMKSITAYSSQFYDPKNIEPETFISQPNFLRFIISRAEVYGFKIGKTYGEPFYCEEDIELDLAGLL